MVDYQHLRILSEVRRLGSLTAAAEQLNVSQPALSHTIRKFEERHGIQVWEKHGRSLRYTQAGLYLLEVAERVLPQLDHANRVLAEFSSGHRGTLRIGMECHPFQRWLMKLTAPYLDRWRNVDLELRTPTCFDGASALLSHQIDLLVTPDPVERPEILYTSVLDYELVLVVADTHPLATKNCATPADFSEEELITLPVTQDRLDVYTRFLTPANRRPRRRRTVESSELMLQLVASGRGITVVPDWLLKEEGGHLDVRQIRLGEGGLQKSIHLGVRRGEESIEYISAFLELAQSNTGFTHL
ncbi:LysR family transcriptional regulator [Marinobacter hydrocarbonoclasticus]|uniref:LysR family transcriptional regulator n=1 Tax=Marinobacter nauticus TaxID=2743 RepID=UPI001C942402|nr:LysR family transcriptional regulator [Marinobacter nauticus]MBY6193734.1 LysR family transcriptional regulator [Marinobacter nauticus]MBY6214882.1 LysR family transcriptional regulator [Marinobacter nauticus]